MRNKVLTGVVFPLLIVACSSEYSPNQLKLSSQGTFVEKESDDLIDGVLNIQKVTGESLSVEFEDGLPKGDIEQKNSYGQIILKASVVPRQKENKKFSFIAQVFNEAQSKDTNVFSTKDYVDLFVEFSKFDGDFLQISDRDSSKTTGSYENGEKIGKWQTNCSNGELKNLVTYKKVSSAVITVGKQLKQSCAGDVLLSAERDDQGRLQGEFIENRLSSRGLASTENAKAKLTKVSIKNYVDGKLEGSAEKYGYDGKLTTRTQYRQGLKHGEEEVYQASFALYGNEKSHYLFSKTSFESDLKQGSYTEYDPTGKIVQAGQYSNNQEIGIWTVIDSRKNTRYFADYDANNFIQEKSNAFSEACAIPKNNWSKVQWTKKNKLSIPDCIYFIENKVIDFNKKLNLDVRYNKEFKSSSNWTYPIIVSSPAVYEKLIHNGAKTNVADSQGRTRLHWCVDQIMQERLIYRKGVDEVRCSLHHAKEIVNSVGLDSISNQGAVLHMIAKQRVTNRYRAADSQLRLLELAKLVIATNANTNISNFSGQTPLMFALRARDYKLANYLLGAGANPTLSDSEQRATLMYMFLNSRNQWHKSEIPAEGVSVLATMIAKGVDVEGVVYSGKPVLHYIELNNTLHYIKAIDEAKAQAEQVASSSVNDKLQQVEKEVNAVDRSEKNLFQEQDNSNEVNLWSKLQGKPAQDVSDTNISADEVVEKNSSSKPRIELKEIEKGSNISRSLNNADVISSEQGAERDAKRDDPGDGDKVEETDAQSPRLTELLNNQIEFLIEQAEDHIKSYRLRTPEKNSAISSIAQIKKLNSNHPSIKILEKKVADRYVTLARSNSKKGNKAQAYNNLEAARQIGNIDESYDAIRAEITSNLAKKTTQVSKAQNISQANSLPKSSSSRQSKYKKTCTPTVKVTGIPFLGEKLVALQSMPHNVSNVLEKASKYLDNLKDDSIVNKRKGANSITFDQQLKTNKISYTLEYNSNGNQNIVQLEARVKTGLFLSKQNFRNVFCDFILTL